MYVLSFFGLNRELFALFRELDVYVCVLENETEKGELFGKLTYSDHLIELNFRKCIKYERPCLILFPNVEKTVEKKVRSGVFLFLMNLLAG